MQNNLFIVRGSNIEGRGCFAVRPIKKSNPICVMEGEKMAISQLRKKYKEGRERISDPLQINKKEYLDLDQPYIFFNHSCEPNAAIVGQHTMIAVRDIRVDDEITFDYASTEWTDDSFSEWTDPTRNDYQDWSFDCRCGAPSCRGKIKDFPSLPKWLQDFYINQRFVQDFIIEKYGK